jgi:hypothetical protein
VGVEHEGDADAEPAAADGPPLLLDELGDQLERFRLLRKSDAAATDAVLDGLGARSNVDRDIILQLSAQRPLGQPQRFDEAHALAMRALEVLDRNGARQVPVPKRLGPLKPVAATLVGWVCRFIVRNHQAQLVDAITDLYDRRLAWCRPGDPDRMRLWKASRDAHRVKDTYKSNPVGVPAFLLGGAVISGVGTAVRSAADLALGNRAAAIAAVVLVTILFGAVAWVILRGAAVARRRIRLTVERPAQALWETIGRAGNPPQDQARAFALYGIVLTAVSWLVVPAGIFFVVSRF